MNIFLKKIFSFLSIFILIILVTPSTNSRGIPETFSELANELLPGVVNISTTQLIEDKFNTRPQFQFPPGSPFEDMFRDFFDMDRNNNTPRKKRATSLGSGFVIDETGYIVTNNHVIGEADQIEVVFQNGTKLEAELIGKDSKVDIAVLKVKPKKKLKSLKWGDSSKSKVGDWVLAIGNPFGLGGTVTAGIISAKSRDIRMGQYDSFIQTDASINKGNSGGPMFNMEGEIIGINSAIFSPSGGSVGIGFAIPSTMAIGVIEQLKKFGKTSRGWLGVRIQLVTEEIAEAYGLDNPKGALVASVENNSPSFKAGVKPGDIILKFDEKNIKKDRDLPRIVAATKVGKNVKLEIWRTNRIINLKVRLGELESFENIKKAEIEKKNIPNKIENLGIQLTKITPNLRTRFNISKDIKGVLILNVERNGAAAERGLKAGDIILAIVDNDASQTYQKVSSPIEVINKIKQLKKGKKKILLLYVQHLNGTPGYVPLKIDG
jgi:serine protease Do